MENLSSKAMAVVSPSMVRAVFNELCRNGYSERQIEALSKELGGMAAARRERNEARNLWRLGEQRPGYNTSDAEDGLFVIGCPEGFESLCLKSA